MKSVAIIGAGPAGLVAGAYLLDQGVEVTIIERHTFPRVIIGESLLPLSMEHFKEVGYFEALNAANFTVKPGARFIRENKLADFSFSHQFTDGWTWTWQVPRAEFDMIMADEFVRRGGKIEFNSTVASIATGKEPEIVYQNSGNTITINPDFIIDASGFGCVLAKATGQKVVRHENSNWAVFTHARDLNRADYPSPDRLCFHVMAQDLWMWMIPFSSGITSLGFVGNKSHFAKDVTDNEQYFRELVASSDRLGDRFEGMEYAFEPAWFRGFSQVSDMLYGDNWVVCGNSVEFLDPVFSSGVALATHSGLLAAKLITRQFKDGKVDWEVEYGDNIRAGVDVFRTYVELWYNGKFQAIMFSENLNDDFKRHICSVLAGYVWDYSNPFVRRHRRALEALYKVTTL